MQIVRQKIEQAIERLDLDLSGKTVLTEAATGPYAVTAVIAAVAGAKVYAYAEASKYGSVSDAFLATKKLIAAFDSLDITFIDELTPELLSQIDILTNSGHLRPLDRDKLQHVGKSLVIPLMYESWELRDDDVDLAYCRMRGISVVATDERNPHIGVFNYLGDMALKLIFDSGSCLHNNNFVLICNNDFGPYIARSISRLCRKLGVIDREVNKKHYIFDEHCEWIGCYPNVYIPEDYATAEAIIFTASPFAVEHIGVSAEIEVEAIAHQFSHPRLLRFAGEISTADCDNVGVEYYPREVKPGHMGVLPSDIGFDPVVRLQAGGLWSTTRVGG